MDTSFIVENNEREEPSVNVSEPICTCEWCCRTGYTMPIGIKTIPFSWEITNYYKKPIAFHIHDNIKPVFLDPDGIPFNFDRSGVALFTNPNGGNGKCNIRKPTCVYQHCPIRTQN